MYSAQTKVCQTDRTKQEGVSLSKNNIVIVKNNQPELDLMTAYISEIFEQHECAGATVIGFLDPKKALEHIAQNGCDILFSDIELCGMDGLLFLREVQKRSPQTNIVITTAYDEYVVEAVQMQIRLAGYLSLPVTISKIGKLISNILSQMKVAEAG